MPQDQTNSRSSVGAKVPTNKKSALQAFAHSRSTPYETVYVSTLVEEAIDKFLSDNWDELPQEAKDDLDADLLANAGGTDEVEA